MQEVLIYLDDSGVLHPNAPANYFVYAGYIFLSRAEKDRALAAYRSAEKRIRANKPKAALEHTELKACWLKGKHKRYLTSVLRESEALACLVDKSQIRADILTDKHSTHRYKDYCVKRLVRFKIEQLINSDKLNPQLPTKINICIDNQPTATNGYYHLADGIQEELNKGVLNFDYGVFHPPIFSNSAQVTVHYCDSSCNTLIRASDLLANSVWTDANYSPGFAIQNKHLDCLHLPR